MGGAEATHSLTLFSWAGLSTVGQRWVGPGGDAQRGTRGRSTWAERKGEQLAQKKGECKTRIAKTNPDDPAATTTKRENESR